MAFRIIVCGSRTWTNRDRIYVDLFSFKHLVPQPAQPVVIIHGAAQGADSCADSVAQELGLTIESYPADWARLGKSAGPVRNRMMLSAFPNLVLAYRIMGVSRGTDDMVAISQAASVPVRITYEDGKVEYR